MWAAIKTNLIGQTMDIKSKSITQFIALLGLCFFSLPLSSEPLPKKVSDFIQHRENCDHLRGEIPDTEDQEQMQKVIKSINQACKGTDFQLKALKSNYKSNPTIIKILNDFEENIEAN